MSFGTPMGLPGSGIPPRRSGSPRGRPEPSSRPSLARERELAGLSPILAGLTDPDEKDYAGRLDKDCDLDLVVVRKQPFTPPAGSPTCSSSSDGPW